MSSQLGLPLSIIFCFLSFNQTSFAQRTTPLTPEQSLPQTFPFSLQTSEKKSASDLNIEFPVEKFVLENGLTVLLAPDRSIPMVSYHTWYKVGSRNESPGVTGAAHMLEHMMFKGAKKYSGKDFDRILHENGITNNAFTSWDYTGFYQNLPSSKLELMMDMEVDRMRFLRIDPKDLLSEQQVVAEERRWRVDNNPQGLMREVLFGELFKVHPYNWPVIGTMDDIQAYTSQKLRYFYDKYYVPNNAVLVLSGDFQVEPTKKLIQKYYGRLKARPLTEKTFPAEPRRQMSSLKVVEMQIQAPALEIGLQGLSAGDPESYALDLLAAVLGDGQSSRLYKKLVLEGSQTSSVGSFSLANKDPGAFLVSAQLKPDADLKAVEKIVLSELEKLKTSLVSERELQRAKRKVVADYVDNLTTIDGKAQALALNEIIFGDYRRLFSDLERYEKVTPLQIQRAAQKYLKSQYRVTVQLVPQKARAE
jgi:zinc protease